MKTLYKRAVVVILGLAFGLSSAVAEIPPIVQEDLSECGLPHGMTEIPEQGAPAAVKAGGEILRMDGGRLVPSPWAKDRKPKSMAEFVQRVRVEKTGDLSYSSLNNGTLIAMSGKLTDLGEHLIYELAGKDLTRPDFVWGKEEKDSTGKGMPGAIERVDSGFCYLLETVEGYFALIRIVSKQERSAIVQWVLQTNGTTRFDVPKVAVGPVNRGTGGEKAVGPVNRGSAGEKGLGQSKARTRIVLPAIQSLTGQPLDEVIKTHLGNRKMLVQGLVELLEHDNVTVQEQLQAIWALGDLRAEEGARVLAKRVEFRDIVTPTREFSIFVEFPSVSALVRIGKPSVFACLNALAHAQSDYALYLHAQVIVLVEGKDLAEVLLKDRIEKTKDAGHRKRLDAVLQRIRSERDRLSAFDPMCTNQALPVLWGGL